MTEKRRSPRVPHEADVEVRVKGGGAFAARCRDVSVGGMFLESPEQPAFGAELTLSFELPGLGRTALPAVVRWSSAEGFGVQFGLLGVRETRALGELTRG